MASGLLSLKWNHHRSTFLHVLANIRQKESYCDVTLACAGKFYSAHKLVLSTCSEYFEEMFERTQCKHPVIVLKDIGADELEALLSYMYDGEVNVLQEHLSSLIKAAECLKIKGLAVADSDPTEHSGSKSSSKDKSSSGSGGGGGISSNSKDVHRSHNSTSSNSNTHSNSFQSDSSSRQFRNSSGGGGGGGVKRPSLSSKLEDGPSKRRRPEPSSPARRHSSERPSSVPRGGAAAAEGKDGGDDGASDGGDGGGGGGDDGGNGMDRPPSPADDQQTEDGGDDAQSFAEGLSEQTGVKAEPVEIIDSDDMAGFDHQAGDGGSHDASDAEFTEEKFAGGSAEANDPSLWGGGANNDMFSQPSTSSFTGQDGSNSNDNNTSGGGKGGGSSMTADQYLRYLESNSSNIINNNMSAAGGGADQHVDVHEAHQHYLERYLKRQHSQHQLSVALLPPHLQSALPASPSYASSSSSEKGNLHQKQMIRALQQQQQMQQQHQHLPESAGPSTDLLGPDSDRDGNAVVPRLKMNPTVGSASLAGILIEPSSITSPRRNIPRIDIDSETQTSLLERFVDGQRTKCPYCNFACVRKDNYKIHLRRHTGEKPYVCSYCIKGFASKPEMSIHEKTHTGEKDYLCSHCDYRGKRKYNLQMHLLNRHPNEPTTNFPH